MLLIRNSDDKSTWSSGQQSIFVKKCEEYINNLKKEGKLIAAQPLARAGIVISGSAEKWIERQFSPSGEFQVGYYHILANDLAEAVSIAKMNPEFEFGSAASIEVRPIKMKEKETGFVYPK